MTVYIVTNSHPSGPDTATSSPAPGVQVLAAQVAAASARAAANTTQWQAFKARLDAQLDAPIQTSYEGDGLLWAADYALGYQCLKGTDATTAAHYADKAIAVMLYGLRDGQRDLAGSGQFLARGDGTTTAFTLPVGPGPTIANLAVYAPAVSVATLVKGAANGQDHIGVFDVEILKVSSTSDGAADYARSTRTSHFPSAWSAGDWRQAGDFGQYYEDTVDWSLASGTQPTTGATYYATYAGIQGIGAASGCTFDPATNRITFSVAPAANQAIFFTCCYGTFSSGATTLAHRQTSGGWGGLNTAFVDTDGYCFRYMRCIPMAFDWLFGYPGLATSIQGEAMDMFNRWAINARDSGFNRDSTTSNYGCGEYAYRAMVALAMGGRDAANGARYIAEIRSYYPANVVATTYASPTPGLGTYRGGFWGEGWNYGPQAAWQVAMSALALAGGGLIPDIAADRAWATSAILAALHCRPTTATYTYNGASYQGYIYDGGDGYAYPESFPPKTMFYLLAAAADDSAARAYANSVIQDAVGAQSADHHDLLFRDPSATATDPATAMPLQYLSDGMGLALSRDDWTYGTTWLSVQVGNLATTLDHSMVAQGHISLWRGGDDLLVTATEITGTQAPSQKSQISNLVVVDDGGDGHQTYRFNQGVWYGTPGCGITAFEGAAAYCYAAGDYRAAYGLNTTPGTGSASELTRSVLHLRPARVVVYDRASTALSAAYAKELRWHFSGSLAGSGDSWTVTSTSSSSKLFGVTLSSAGLATNREDAITIGGDTSWSDNSVGVTRSVQRVRVNPASATTSLRYVTCLQSAPAAASAMDATAYVSTGDGKMEGALFGQSLVLFGATITTAPSGNDLAKYVPASPWSYAYTAPGGTLTHYLCDLTPGHTYTLSGSASGTATSSPAGVLTFATTGTGPQAVAVS